MGFFIGNTPTPTQQTEWDSEHEDEKIEVLFELVKKRINEIQELAEIHRNKKLKNRTIREAGEKCVKLLELTKGNLNQIKWKLNEEALFG